MTFHIKSDNPNYLAKIVKLPELRPHPNADRLALVTVENQVIITSKDSRPGDLFIFFPLECQINTEFLSFINGYSDPELNRDKTKRGFFNSKGRVRAQKLRGVLSEGYLHPVSDLNEWLKFKGYPCDITDEAIVGVEFSHFSDIEICKKYVNLQELRRQQHINKSKGGKVKRESRLVDNQFRLSPDYKQLKREIHNINPDDWIEITAKIHGCVDGETILESLEYGPIPIREIIEKKQNIHVKSFNLQCNEVCFSEVTDFFEKSGDDIEWYEIELDDGKTVKVTENHPFWLHKQKCYREAKKLKIGDSLLVLT